MKTSVRNGIKKRVYNKKQLNNKKQVKQVEHKYDLEILEDLPFLAKDNDIGVVAEVDITNVTNHTDFYKFRTQSLKNLISYASKHDDTIEIMLAPYKNDDVALCVAKCLKSGKTYALAGVRWEYGRIKKLSFVSEL